MKIVIIIGPSGSGKSTLAKSLFDRLKYAYVISTDNYYKTGLISQLLSILVKSYFDYPISLNKKLIKNDIKNILEKKTISNFYQYDFINKKRVKLYKNIPRINYLIIEGIFALEIIKFIKNQDFILVKLKTTKKVCRERICLRDSQERGKNKKNSLKDFTDAWDIYKKKESNFNLKKFKNIILINKLSDREKILKLLSKEIQAN